MSSDIAEIRERIKKTIVQSLELEIDPTGIRDDRLLFTPALADGMDLDSLAAIDIVVGLSNEFRLALDEVPREAFRSVATLGDFIATMLDRRPA